jgi:hypothetical protein
MEKLTGRYPALLCPSSMSGGNTQNNERTRALEQSARGSVSIVPPSPTSDNVITLDMPLEDFARLRDQSGGEAVRPGDSGGAWTTVFQSGDGGWQQT